MNYPHFIYGSFDNQGVKLIKSAGVDALLDQETLSYLCHIGGNVHEEKRLHVLLPRHNCIAAIYLRPAKDEYNRKTVWNHTILVPYPNFETHYIKTLEAPPNHLPKLKVTA